MNYTIIYFVLAVGCSVGKAHERRADQAPSPETIPADSRNADMKTKCTNQDESSTNQATVDYVSGQFENYRYQVPQIFMQYSSPGDDDVFLSSRTYVLPKQALPNSVDNGIYLTLGKVKCESRDAYLDSKRKEYEKLGVPLCDGLVQGGHLNARSISWKKNYAYIMTVFDRDPVDGTCFVNNAAVYGPEEWNQHQSVVAALQIMAQSLSRDEANK